MLEPVVVRKRKFDGRIKSEWEGELIEVGDSWATVHHDPLMHEKLEGGRSAPQPNHHFHVVGLDVPLTVLATFADDGSLIEAKLDAALPGTLSGSVLEFVDLDLDVIVEPSGAYWTRDLATFASNCESMAYTSDAIAFAYEGMRLGLGIARTHAYPLGGALDRTLAECLERAGLAAGSER